MSHGHRHYISSTKLTLADLTPFFRMAVELQLSPDARQRIEKCRAYLDEMFAVADLVSEMDKNTDRPRLRAVAA